MDDVKIDIKSNALIINMKELDNLFDFLSESRLPVCLWGVKAVGKTTAINEIGERLGYRVETLHLATQDIVDLIGMPEKIEISEGEYEMKWSRPEWLHTDGKPTIYFLDEMNRSNKFVSAAMLPFLNEGKIHRHSIGPKDFVVAACNPSDGNYVVNDAFEQDEALRDRCGHVILKPTDGEWMGYAESKTLSTTLKVIEKNLNWIKLKDFSLPFKIEPSRRSLINVMGIVDSKDESWIRRNARVAIGAYMGSEFLTEWWEERFKNTNYLTLAELQNIDQNKKRIIEAISTVQSGRHTVKNDIFEAAVDLIVEWFEREYRDGITMTDWVFELFSIDFIPKDSFVAMMSRINILDKPILLQKIYDSSLIDTLEHVQYAKNIAA
jgi:hypothetical protein